MATNEPAKLGRELALQAVHYLRKRVTFADEGSVVDVGRIPAGASVVSGGIHVVTAFDDTTAIDVGFRDGSSTDDPDAYGSALVATAVGYIALDGLATTANIQQTAEAIVTVSVNDGTGASAAGVADVIVGFVLDNDA